MKIKSELITELAACFLVFILMFVVLGVVANVNTDVGSASTTYTNIDTFEDDTNNTDPNGNSSAGDYNPFYTYDEIGWDGGDGGYDNVTNTTDYQFDGDNGMWYYGNDSFADGTYYLLGEDGNELCGRTDIDTITWAMNFEFNTFNWDVANVSLGTDVSLYDCDLGLIVWLVVNETNATLYTTGPTVLMQIPISNMTFYRVEVTIDYLPSGTPEVTSEFWGLDLPGFFTVLLDSNTTPIDCSKLWFVLYTPARAGDWSNMVFDDFQFVFTVNSETTSALDDLPIMWGIVIGVIVLAIVIGILFIAISEAKKKK